MGRSYISLDTSSADAVPYFNWDAPVTNAAVRRALADGTEDDKLFGLPASCATRATPTSGLM